MFFFSCLAPPFKPPRILCTKRLQTAPTVCWLDSSKGTRAAGSLLVAAILLVRTRLATSGLHKRPNRCRRNKEGGRAGGGAHQGAPCAHLRVRASPGKLLRPVVRAPLDLDLQAALTTVRKGERTLERRPSSHWPPASAFATRPATTSSSSKFCLANV